MLSDSKRHRVMNEIVPRFVIPSFPGSTKEDEGGEVEARNTSSVETFGGLGMRSNNAVLINCDAFMDISGDNCAISSFNESEVFKMNDFLAG